MSIKIGEVDVASQILENEFRILVLEQVVDALLRRIPIVGPAISKQEMQDIRRRAVEQLKKKYPNSGIELKEGANG